MGFGGGLRKKKFQGTQEVPTTPANEGVAGGNEGDFVECRMCCGRYHVKCVVAAGFLEAKHKKNVEAVAFVCGQCGGSARVNVPGEGESLQNVGRNARVQEPSEEEDDDPLGVAASLLPGKRKARNNSAKDKQIDESRKQIDRLSASLRDHLLKMKDKVEYVTNAAAEAKHEWGPKVGRRLTWIDSIWTSLQEHMKWEESLNKPQVGTRQSERQPKPSRRNGK